MTLFCAYVGAAVVLKDTANHPWYLIVLLIVSAMVGIAFVVTGTIYLWQYIQSCKKAKREVIHKQCVESFKVLFLRQGRSEEEAQKMAEIAAMGDTEPYQPVDGLEDDGWISTREARNKSCRKEK